MRAAGIKRRPPSEDARERKRIKSAQYRKDNREKISERGRQRRLERMENDPAYAERCRASVRRYAAENPEVIRNIRRQRKARVRNAEGTHSVEDVAAILKAQTGRCANPACRKKLGKNYHVDHIRPIARGGSNERTNLQLMCAPCNQKKHSKDPIEWARSNGFLL